VVAADEVVEIGVGQPLGLERLVHIGAVVVDLPQPRHCT
jgi:hypothetical protein